MSNKYATLEVWLNALQVARDKPEHPLWQTDHLHLRDMPRHCVNEALMVERLWMAMGPSEHRWFSTFMPDVVDLYPLETTAVQPWNADVALAHYGRKPVLHYQVLERELYDVIVATSKKHAAIGQAWQAHRERHGMVTNAWQLVQEIVDSLHLHDNKPMAPRALYPSSVSEERLQVLETMVPDEDWVLALACAGIPTDRLRDRLRLNSLANSLLPAGAQTELPNEVQLRESERRALAWLHWWLEKSPDCMDNLAFGWVGSLEHGQFPSTNDGVTSILQSLNAHAKDARDTFVQARAVYGDLKEDAAFTIPSSELCSVFLQP